MKWSDEEISFLVENYNKQGIRFCMKQTGRTWDSIKRKASDLGLRVSAVHTLKKSNSKYDAELFYKEIDVLRIDDYINNRTPITHECLNGHRWKISPTNVLKGINYPICSDYGFNPELKAILYLVKLNLDIPVYKLGITNKISVEERFPKRDFKLMTVEWCEKYSTGYAARKAEKELHNEYSSYRIHIGNILESGNTECFTKRIPSRREF